MSDAQTLQQAAERMSKSTNTERSVVRRVTDIAERMASGQATKQEIAWARRNASSFIRRT